MYFSEFLFAAAADDDNDDDFIIVTSKSLFATIHEQLKINSLNINLKSGKSNSMQSCIILFY